MPGGGRLITETIWALAVPIAAALLLYGGMQVLDGAITTGDLVMFLTYLVLLLVRSRRSHRAATSFRPTSPDWIACSIFSTNPRASRSRHR